ncbi:hypothetical protein NOS3756_01120 [Nostoc sp. NIES-3756]|uniref:hypothetical protein n=1 Tax=Nostoc sp. NIES-3756 TaxID=1751286 RepID=UPI000722FB91|nr:hypothetical protein [Nostoc sp. NIES-3756]BAT51190.1 hypothetical protein NOS3756_01120 [Nostoc sp. NIES-3756]
MVHRDALKEKSAAIKEVIAVLSREAEWLNQNPQEAQTLYQKVTELPSDVVTQTFKRRPVDGVLPLDEKVINDLQDAANWIQEQGIVEKKVDVRSSLCPQS